MKRNEILIVLGNGPSLKGFDFARLRGFDAIGMNAAYRHWDEIGWYPKYYFCLDTVVGVSHRQEITRLIRESDQNGIKAFVLRKCLIEMLPNDVHAKAVVLDFDVLRKTLPIFKKTQPITTGSHSAIFGAMCGYKHIFLLGVDCNYVERVDGSVARKGTVLEIKQPPADNPNYFFDGYQLAGDLYNVPNPSPDLHIKAWRVAARVLAKHQVTVWNGSSVSQVKDFPFHDFSHLEKRVSRVRQWFQTISRWKAPLPENDRNVTSDVARSTDEECVGSPTEMFHRVVTCVYDQMLRPHGILFSQMNILTDVSLRGPIPLADVGRRLAIEELTLRSNVAQMEQNGWIESQPEPNGNDHLLELTRQGIQLIKRAMPACRKAQERLIKLLGDEVAENFHEATDAGECGIALESRQAEPRNCHSPVQRPNLGTTSDLAAVSKPPNAA